MIPKLKFEYKITIIYIFLGGAWIIFSDTILDSIIQDKSVITKLQTYKGWFYVLLTASILFLFLRKHLANLRIIQKKAEESDQLKTAFLHNISHEIRTPMNAIVGFSDLLNNPDLEFEKRQAYTEIIGQSSDYLLSVITDIVNISTIESGQERLIEKELNLNELLGQILLQYAHKAEQHKLTLNVSCSLKDREANIITDKIKLSTILVNLIGNAIKFTKEGHVNMGYTVIGDTLEFFVQDSGIGISPDMHDEIFKRFRQVECSTERQFGGSGLGLSITKAYVELIGGNIWLKSELDKGSVFYFTIPYKKVDNSRSTEEVYEKKAKKEFVSPKTLLVAEDDEFNFMLLVELLPTSNLTILRAFNGQEAVDICKTNQQVDLILMDIKMPILDGYEATAQIKKIRPHLPVIAQTAYSTDIDIAKAYSCGCSDFVSKPFNQEHLLDKIFKLIATP